MVNLKTKYFGKNTLLLLFIPLILSAFINTWNLTGFPSLHVDEGYYMWKTISTLQIQDLQPTDSYFAPYFGQIFMASILGLIGYPDTLNPNLDASSIESLYLIPRLIMSIFAILDTFLIFKITEKRYGVKVAFIATVLFVVMPYGWLLKRIFLETIQLPLLLTSVLLLLYLKKDIDITKPHRSEIKNITFILFSGTFLGLAIFTKIPVVAMIPLIGYLVFTNSNNNRFKNLAIWFIPVILIPLIWPVHAYSIGEFDKWIEDVLYQTQRESKPLINTLTTYFENDPVMFLLGFAGIVYAVIKRDYFILLFSIPFLLFLYWIDYVSAFHLIPLFPIFAIAGSKVIVELFNLLPNLKIRNSLPYITLSVIAIFCLISVFLLISIDTNSLIFQTQVELIHYLQKTNGSVTLVGSALYLWIPHYIFDLYYNTTSYDSTKPLQTNKFILIDDPRYQKIIKEKTPRGIFHNELFSQTKLVETVKLQPPVKKYNISVYPYTNLRQSSITKNIEIRSNY
ncbi:MAG: glycosyltransferase family 39 protein [Nitrososphaeraceae archaeon]|nr:glycosyltransferase family 39 protein [Nitrososphaeraceae archaeon]